ncbi:hypothetical protein [Albirhodobacter sp. R86504]|jgi:hypothetical protein|uniref:hypothetical protein n=1 Tax=Albirhodobacter sp. R86504 TaxID=3093848 RepID=UPI0036734242
MDSEILAALERLEGLLQVERHLIKGGNFDELDTLAREKDIAMAAVLNDPASTRLHFDRLMQLREVAERNQRLIGAALKGIRAAQRRLEMIQRASKSIDSYDQLGRAKTIGSTAHHIERKA